MKRFNPEKELYRIQYGKRNKIIFTMVFGIILLTIGYSFALYQVRYSKRIIYTKVAPFSNKDIELAIYLDDTPSTDNLFPEKNDGYVYSKTVCDNNSKVYFDSVNWELNLKSKGKDNCDVYFVKDSSIPNPPELYQGLIPVIFDESGKVLVADLTTDWYNYDEHRWANAVLVNTTKYNELIYNGSIKEDKYGTEIGMSDILQMYVWIPRYKYQLFNAINGESIAEQEIKIQFESGTASTGDITCEIDTKGKETCENAQNGNWYTHPAFKFGNTDLTGIWIGKFEPSGNAAALTIKPNITSWRKINLKTMFDATRNIEETYSTNFNLNKEQIDTHVMKNMEWGAMVYFTQSKYGRCDGNGKCTEVTINGNSDYLTGYANTGSAWQTVEGQKASTAGNLYGIYDTNGGAWDYVMAVTMINITGSGINYSGSGFAVNTKPDEKYYDVYEYDYSSWTTHARGHLGDATRETLKTFGNDAGEWYDDWAYFPYYSYPWFSRGGDYGQGTHAGAFAFTRNTGAAPVVGNTSFRVVLTAQDGNS